jgi:DNA-binding MarR family transcriptional regulator
MGSQRPIGFWLKLLDQLITEQFESTLEDHGVTRRQWQLLNLLTNDDATQAELTELLAPFVSGPQPQSLGEDLAELVESGWVGQEGEVFALTVKGRTSVTRLGEVVARTRDTLAQGISDEEYQQTLDVLERMSVNLGWSDPVARS